MKELIKALEKYEEMFEDGFPTFSMSGLEEGEMLKIINKCITEGKDVYELGYLSLDIGVEY